MVIKEKSDTTGTMRCPDCGHYIYIVAESFENIKKKNKKAKK